MFCFRICCSYLFLYYHVFLYESFFYFFEQVNVDWKFIKITLILGNYFGVEWSVKWTKNERMRLFDEWIKWIRQIWVWVFIDFLLVENIVLPNQTILLLSKKTYLKLFEIIRITVHVLSIFTAWLVMLFSNLKIKIKILYSIK